MNDSTKYTSIAAVVIMVATVITVCRLLNAVPLQSANDRSRWATVWSIVERQTYTIDEIDRRPGWGTIDKVRHEGHYYSSKPPLMPRLVAEVTACVKKLTGLSLDTKPRTTTRVVLLIVNVLPTVISWIALAWMLPRLRRSTWGCLFVLVVACFATLNAPFLVTLNNHSIAVWSLTLTLACMTWMTTAGPAGRWFAAGLGGLFAAWTCCNELPAAPFGLLAFAWFWRRDWKTAWFAFVPMALIPLGGFMWTNYVVTGGWKPFYLYYGTDKYRHVVDGVPSYWMRPQGLDTNPDTTPQYLFHCTVGHHGMLSLTPVYLLTLLVWLGLSGRSKRKAGDEDMPADTSSNRKLDPELVYGFVRHGGLLLTVITTAFFVSKTENYNYGGNSCALRWTLWLTPLWTVAMLPAVVSFGKTRIGRITANVLLAGSLASAWYPATNPWQHPWIYVVMERAGVIATPRAETAPVEPPDTWIASLPTEPGAFALFDVSGLRPRRVRLTHVGASANGSVLRWEESDGTFDFLIDRAMFEANEPVDAWLLNSSLDRDEAITLLRGLPSPRRYNPGRRDYVKTTAFDTHRSTWKLASRVYNEDTRNWTRRDLWWAADDELNGDQRTDVSFGVIQMIVTVSDRSGNVLSRETWRLRETSTPANDPETPSADASGPSA